MKIQIKNLFLLPALITGLGLFLAPSVQAQFQWSQRIASANSFPEGEPNTGLALDTNDNCYVTGFFDDTNNFGGVTLTNQSAGGSDIFVAKYNSTGALQWAQRAGGSVGNFNYGRGIGTDTNGNVYVTGGYQSPATFGSINLPATSGEEFFLAKYNSAGAVQWVQTSTGGFDDNNGVGLTVDNAGNSYALAVLDHSGTSLTFGSVTVTANNGGTTFLILVKYNNTGNAQWAQLFDTTQETYGSKVAVDAAGNVYVRGTFFSDMTIGNSNLVVSAGSTKNMFIAKFNNSGALIWVKQPQGGDAGEGGVAVDLAGNVFVSGYFDTNLVFGGGIILTNKANSNALFGDAFLAKYNSAGAIQWAQPAGGTNGGFYWDIALDAQTNIYAAGFLGSDAAVAKYSPAGTLQWTDSASGPPASPVSSGVVKCAVDTAGHCYLNGFYQGTATFGATTLQPQETWNFFLTEVTQGTAVFPIATNGVASQAGIFAAFGGTNYLVGIQGDGTANNTNITAQLVSSNGTLIGSRILTGRTGGIPYVASGGTNFLLVWSDNKLVAGGGHDQVYGQFVSRAGALVGSPFTFGPTSEEQDMQGGGGSLLAFDGKNYLAVWDTGAFQNASSGNVHGALFNQSGSLVVPVISITSGVNAELTPVVTFGKTNYLVVWNDVSSGNIDGEFISTNGTQGSAFVINQSTTPSYNPCCAAFDGTNFLVVWNKDIGLGSPNPTVWNLYGRLVSPSGTFPGSEVAMVTDTNSPIYPSIAFDGANYLLAWNEGVRSANSQIVFQFFNRTASPVGQEFNLFSSQGTNAPLFAGVLFDGSRFEITAIVGGATGIGPTGLNFTSGTGTWGTFLSTNITLSPLMVATTSLPTGASGVAYNQTLAAFGGQTPYTWTNNFGALPTGLTLATNGLISGTPTTNGTFNFTVKVTDALSETATQSLTLTVVVPNLVLNGGFETGDFTGWTLAGDTSPYTFVDNGSASGIQPHSGAYVAELGTTSARGFISQTLSTVAGQSYLLSLWLNSPDGLGPNEFLVSWNGNVLFDETNLPAIGWTNIQFVVTATGSSTVLQFGFLDDPSWLGLDDISVQSVQVGPTIQFTASPTNGAPPLTVQFNAANIDSLGNAITSWSWNFGDGATSTAQNPSHIYATAGIFTPALTATNSNSVTVIGVGPQIATLTIIPFTFTNSNGTITITGYTGTDTIVTIPSTINGLPVTSIGLDAFLQNRSLTSVTIPNSITNIGDHAFDGCWNLTSVTIGTNVTSIGNYAFWVCGLTNITIPNNVTSIGSGAFGGCNGLTSVTIPNSVTNIGEGAFFLCANLTAITVSPGNPAYVSIAGVLFNKSQTMLIECPAGNGRTSYAIPNSVTNIGDDTFAGCSSLNSVTIPNSVASIGFQAFLNCTSLTNMYFQGNSPTPNNDSTAFEFDTHVTVYYLPGTAGWGSTFDGVPTAPWFLPNPLILNNGPGFGVQTSGFGFTISWATNISVVVQACTNLAHPVWSPVATNNLISGTSYFSDPKWTNYPGRFYRLRSP